MKLIFFIIFIDNNSPIEIKKIWFSLCHAISHRILSLDVFDNTAVCTPDIETFKWTLLKYLSLSVSLFIYSSLEVIEWSLIYYWIHFGHERDFILPTGYWKYLPNYVESFQWWRSWIYLEKLNIQNDDWKLHKFQIYVFHKTRKSCCLHYFLTYLKL